MYGYTSFWFDGTKIRLLVVEEFTPSEFRPMGWLFEMLKVAHGR